MASYAPEGYQPITPVLAFRDAAGAIEWYTRAFGAAETLHLTAPDGTIAHAELQIAGGMIMLAEENPQYNATPATLGGTSVILHLYVPDVDAFAQRAVEGGARIVVPIADQFYGERSGRLADPYGYLWIVATSKEQVPEEEMQRRFEALTKP
jgi:PhnB protein